MNGGYVHDELLIGILDHEFQKLGAQTQRQVLSRIDEGRGFIDLVVRIDGMLLAIEAERSARRIANDWQKAVHLGADRLWIVVPNHHVLAAVRRQGKRLAIDCRKIEIFYFTLGRALQQVTVLFSKSLSDGK